MSTDVAQPKGTGLPFFIFDENYQQPAIDTFESVSRAMSSIWKGTTLESQLSKKNQRLRCINQ